MSLEESLIETLKQTRTIICTVESCTGGQISHSLTNVSGSSQVFWGATITYDNSAKMSLGVCTETLKNYGAVSEQTARELAEQGLLKMTESLNNATDQTSLSACTDQLCVATTGIAGPTGGSDQKPVGLCYIGLARTGKNTKVLKVLSNPGLSRLENKQEFTRSALEFLFQELTSS